MSAYVFISVLKNLNYGSTFISKVISKHKDDKLINVLYFQR